MVKSKNTIILVGGWTGWHITPLVSLSKILWPNNNYEWIGERWWLEENISKSENIPFHPIHAEKLRREFSWKTLLIPGKMLLGVFESIIIISKLKPDFIFSKWSHISIPVAFAAKILWIPFYLHESDTIPWLANRITGKFAKKIFLWFQSASKYFPKTKTIVIWQIINPELIALSNKWIDTVISGKIRLLVICWSQGSQNIFNWLIKNIDRFNASFDVCVVLGLKNIGLRSQFTKAHVKTIDFANIQELWELYNWADIAITRWSATTLGELDIFHIKKIIVPLPWSWWNHQYYNALEYNTPDNLIIEEKNLYNPETIQLIIQKFSCWENKKIQQIIQSSNSEKQIYLLKKTLINHEKYTSDKKIYDS
mgnify:CR=1 FL=1